MSYSLYLQAMSKCDIRGFNIPDVANLRSQMPYEIRVIHIGISQEKFDHSEGTHLHITIEFIIS